MRKDKYLLKLIVFSVLLAFNTSLIFHVNAQNSLPKSNNVGKRPAWCPEPGNPGLVSVCGTVRSAVLEPNEKGEYLPNMEKEGITVAVYEENPLSPTGKLEGKFTNLFSSTVTNKLGRYHITVRKTGPPNVKVHIVFTCNGTIVGHQQIENWHDYWGLDQQVSCPESTYVAPLMPIDTVDRAQFLSCNNEPGQATAVGMAKNFQPTVNNVAQDLNYEIGHGQNTLCINGISIAGFEIPACVTGVGGLWEPTCLIRHNQYVCNVAPSKCSTWENNQDQSDLGDGKFCNNEDPALVGPMDIDNYLTSPFFAFLPKAGTGPFPEVPRRRFDIRSDIEQVALDKLAPLQWTATYWGSSYTHPVFGPFAFFRKFLEDDEGDKLPSCSDFKKRNNAYEIKKFPERNRQLNGGPLGGLASPSDDIQNVYYSQIRDLSQEVCVNESGVPIKLCEIQPPWPPVSLCDVNTGSCSDPNTSCGEFKYGSEYFPTDLVFAVGAADMWYLSQTQNDSEGANDGGGDYAKPLQHIVFDQESVNPHRTASKAKLDSGRAQSSSFNTGASIVNTPVMVPGTKSLTDPLTIPFADDQKDYIDQLEWRVWDFGPRQDGLCTLGKSFDIAIDGPEDEASSDFHPANVFEGNVDHIQHRAAGTGTWYFSGNEGTVRRDQVLRERTTPDEWINPDAKKVQTTGAFSTGLLSAVLGREVWDSILSLMSNKPDWEFSIDFATFTNVVLNAAISGDTDSNVKTFGSRDPSLQFPIVKPYYSVDFALTEANFMDYFELPEYIPGEPGQLYPSAWGPGFPGCYFFPEHTYTLNDSNVEEGQKCNTYREDDYGISRECRVDDCWKFWLVKSAVCTCDSPLGPCSLGGQNLSLYNKECNTEEYSDDRLICAIEQETTADEPVTIDEEEIDVPNVINPDHADFDEDKYEPEDIPASACHVGIFNWNNGTGPKSKTLTRDGDPKRRCEMSVAGPMQGGPGCNGALDVGDAALRFIQQTPPSITQLNLDNLSMQACKTELALNPPYIPQVCGQKKVTIDGRMTKNPNIEGTYTWGADDVEIGGKATPYIHFVASTPTFPGERDEELEDLIYHCDLLGTYNPSGREVLVPNLNFDPEGDGTMGWKCPLNPPPEPEIPELNEGAGGCGISNEAACIAAIQSYGNLTQGISPYALQMINTAANQIGTPAGALMAVLTLEAGFNPVYSVDQPNGQKAFWPNDVAVWKAGVPWYGRWEEGGPAQCNENVWTAQGPYQILRSSMMASLQKPEVCNALNSISSGRCIVGSRCNLLDSSVVAADLLYGGTCGGGYNIRNRLEAYGGGEYSDQNLDQGEIIYNACR